MGWGERHKPNDEVRARQLAAELNGVQVHPTFSADFGDGIKVHVECPSDSDPHVIAQHLVATARGFLLPGRIDEHELEAWLALHQDAS